MSDDGLFAADTPGLNPHDWRQTPCLGLDIEATGVDVYQDRILELALVEIRPGQRPITHQWWLNPGIPIPPESTEVHGITNEFIQEHGRDPGDCLFEITGRIALWLRKQQYPLVAFNAPFDLTMLEAENKRHDVGTIASRIGFNQIRPIIDPMVLVNYAEKYRKKICACGCGSTDKTLAGWLTHFGIRNAGSHGAVGDALAACRLWPAILNKHGATKFRDMDLHMLHEKQIGWKAIQMMDLREYFDREKIEHDGCDGSWPLRSPTPPPVLLIEKEDTRTIDTLVTVPAHIDPVTGEPYDVPPF